MGLFYRTWSRWFSLSSNAGHDFPLAEFGGQDITMTKVDLGSHAG